jgi:acyl dehydratase
MRHWEDIREGEWIDCGSYKLTTEEIIEFAKKFDPQPFHVDPQRASKSIYGGIIASGFHTLALVNRMAYDCCLKDVASMGSTALDDVRWEQPVRAGDHLVLRLRVQEKVQSRSKTDRGMIRFRYELFNGKREQVMTMTVIEIVAKRGEDMPKLMV